MAFLKDTRIDGNLSVEGDVFATNGIIMASGDFSPFYEDKDSLQLNKYIKFAADTTGKITASNILENNMNFTLDQYKNYNINTGLNINLISNSQDINTPSKNTSTENSELIPIYETSKTLSSLSAGTQYIELDGKLFITTPDEEIRDHYTYSKEERLYFKKVLLTKTTRSRKVKTK